MNQSLTLQLIIGADGRVAVAEAGKVTAAVTGIGAASVDAAQKSTAADERMRVGLAGLESQAGRTRVGVEQLGASGTRVAEAVGQIGSAGTQALAALEAKAQTAGRTLSAALGITGTRNLAAERQQAEAALAMQAQAKARLGEIDAARTAQARSQSATVVAGLLSEARAATAAGSAQAAAAQGARALAVSEADLRAVLQSIITPAEHHSQQLARINALYEAGALSTTLYHRAIAASKADLVAQTAAANGLGNGLSGAAKGIIGFAAAAKLVELGRTTAQMQDFETRLHGVTDATGSFAQSEQFLFNLAEKHHKSILSLADGYTNLIALEETGAVTRKEVEQITAGLSNEQSRMGVSSAQLSQVLYGLNQSLSSSIVQMDEMRQTTDPLPGLMNRVERAVGFTAGTFKKLSDVGQGVSRDLFKKGLIIALQESEGAAERAGNNINAHLADIRREWELTAKALQAPISAIIRVELGGATRLLSWVRGGAEALGKPDFLPDIFGGGLSDDKLGAAYEADLKRMIGRAFPGPASASAAGGVQAMIDAAAQKFGTPAALVRAIGMAESTMQQTDPKTGRITTSSTGALGTMQLMPATAKAYGVDPTDQSQNIEGGAHYLADLIQKYTAKYKDAQTALTAAIAAYNLGETKFDKRGLSNLPDETKTYVERVKKLLEGSDIAGRIINLKDYKANLDEARIEFQAQQDHTVAIAEDTAKRLAAKTATAMAELDAAMADHAAQRAENTANLTGADRRQAELKNLQLEAQDAETYARRRSEIEQRSIGQEEQAAQARLRSAQAERDHAAQFEVQAADRLKLDDQVKSAETELAALAERRRQIEVKSAADIAQAQTKEMEARAQARQAALQQEETAIGQAQQLVAAKAQGIQAQLSAGVISQGQARNALAQYYREGADAIAQNVHNLEALAEQNKSPEYTLAAERSKAAWLDMLASTRTPMENLLAQWRDTTGQMEQASLGWADSLANVMADVLTTGRADFKGFIQGINRDLALISSRQALAAIYGAVAGPGSNPYSSGIAPGTVSNPISVDISGASVRALASSSWEAVKGWIGGAEVVGGGAVGNPGTMQIGQGGAMAGTLNNWMSGSSGYQPQSISANSAGGFNWGAAATALAPSALGALAGAITPKTQFAPYMADKSLLQFQSISADIADAIGNIPGWTMLAKLLRPAIGFENHMFQSTFPDRKMTMGGWIAGQSLLGPLGFLLSGWMAPIVKSGAVYDWRGGRDGLYNTAKYTQNGAPIGALTSGADAVSQGLVKAEGILGVDIGRFGAEFRNRGDRFWINGFDAKSGDYFSQLGGKKGIRLTEQNLKDNLDLFETAVLKRAEVLKQFDDRMVRGAISLSQNLSEVADNLQKVSKIRVFEGEQTGLTAQLTKARAQYLDMGRDIIRFSPNAGRQRDELRDLDRAYQRQFDAQVSQFRNSVSAFGGGPSNTLIDSIRQINDTARQLQAQNRELADAAKKSKGTLAYTPLKESDIEAARQAALAKAQTDFLANLRQLAGVATPLAAQFADLSTKFKQFAADAKAAGVDTAALGATLAGQIAGLVTAAAAPILDARASLGASILNIQGADGTGAALTEARSALANNTNADLELSLIQRVQSAVEARYNAELSRLQKLQQVGDYARGLGASDLSTATPAARLLEARNLYLGDLGKAKGGDAEAIARLTGEADNYLKEARSYYASSADYSKIFAGVRADLADMGASAAGDIATLKDSTVVELQTLQGRVGDLLAPILATAAAANASALTLGQINQGQADLVTNLLAYLSTASATSAGAAAVAGNIQGQGATAVNQAPVITPGVNDPLTQSIQNYNPATDTTAGWPWLSTVDSGQQFPVPRYFAEGGYAAPGWAVVGEKGPELINFSDPGRVYTADQTRAALSGGGDITSAVEQLASKLAEQDARNNQRLLSAIDRLLGAIQDGHAISEDSAQKIAREVRLGLAKRAA